MSAATPVLPNSLSAAHALIQELHWQVQQLKKQLYGPSAERAPLPENYSKEQILLNMFPAPAEPPATENVVLPENPASEPTPARPRRQPEIKAIETVTQRIEPAEKICPHCGKEKCEIGHERTERFEYIPAKVIRQEILRPKLACPCGEGKVSIAPLPAGPVDKGMPGPGLLAQVVLSKYEDHLPLDRQRKMFERLGVIFPRQTLCDWIDKAAHWLEPVARLMKEQLLAGDYLQADETPVRVLDPEVQGKAAQGYLWVIGRPREDVIFEFHPGRSKACALEMIGDFAGFLQCDGYGVYHSIAVERPEIKRVGCLAHGRRKFIDAVQDEPMQAQWFVGEIRKLYLLEAHARENRYTVEQRQQLREQNAPPIWKAMGQRLGELSGSYLPQSPMGKAVRYALNEWESWQLYLKDGRIEIDNNLTENAIRPSALGKKNWLFVGHPHAGWRSAVIYSIIVSCRRHQIDPWEYLQDLFTRLPSATNQQLADFTPARWKTLR